MRKDNEITLTATGNSEDAVIDRKTGICVYKGIELTRTEVEAILSAYEQMDK